ncbi:hypothetical protein [Maribacter polysaccharolyticus]|uniref:hypothetical protein n=1 Tax=Maribacter polysaccharolyticus TaxID=3020831 RepID=UPI00237F3650|nr:hypothetical protein [Maribacter polysaccharolyticus]MDE3744127.1 hypothetical protein [Maribacter polysaccharolyticus]
MRFKIGLLAFIFISSCSNDENSVEILKFSLTDFPQTWELSSINAGLSGEIINAEEISVSEIYVLNDNGTFSKEFQDEFVQGNMNGTYDITTTENREYLIFTYEVDIDSLSYCSNGNVETMLVSDNEQILSNGSCLAFDSPAMYYERIE